MRLTLEAGLYWVLKNTHTYTHSPEAGALSALIHTHLHTSILIISITEQKCRNVCATVTTHGFPLFYYYSEIPLIMSSCTSKKHNKNMHMTFKANIVFFIGPALLSTYLVKRKCFHLEGNSLMCLIFCLVITLIFKHLLCANYYFLKAKIITFNCLLQHRIRGFCCLSSGETEAALAV